MWKSRLLKIGLRILPLIFVAASIGFHYIWVGVVDFSGGGGFW